jgi:two-component system nitrogen regulation sensor histidine kinase NtrY
MLESIDDNRQAEQKRRHREFYIILLVVPAIVLLTYIETYIPFISGDIPIATNIFVLGLININILLLLLLIFLILRNAVKLFFESKRNILGSKLRTKLVASFVCLTIVPTFLIFFVVIGFINKSIDSWFDIKIEDSLKESLELAQNFYRDTSDKTQAAADRIALSVGGYLGSGEERLRGFAESEREAEDFSTIEVFSAKGDRVAYSISDKVNKNMVPDVSLVPVAEALGGTAKTFVKTLGAGDVVRAAAPVYSNDGDRVIGAVVVSYYVPMNLLQKMKDITAAFEGYSQLKLLKNPVKTTYFTILLIITLLIVFFSIWIGRYLAKEITVPIFELAEGTHAVASGNLDYRINVDSRDEIGLLVKSFNRMTEDLKEGKSRLEQANLDLRSTYDELNRRMGYIEIVLGNIPAGVISIDKAGRITSINRVAAEILGVHDIEVLGSHYNEVLRPEDRDIIREMIREMNELGAETLERQMRVEVRGKVMTVLVNLNALKDENGDYLGMVAVLDDLTHLLKTQRMAAWKEVARRIAHEIKNPLTPIQLSAQRLRKKYLGKFPGDAKVFDDCTTTIVRQVDELKGLVNEFSSFARMPAADPSPNDLNEVVTETVSFYKTGHRNITFDVATDSSLPILQVDRDQIKRALINLFDNAIASIEAEGTVRVTTRFDTELKLARIEVGDTGCGIPAEDKARLFEPYFSTKKSGTGLGLAIVSNIISDHNGYIRVKDNVPAGTVFTIELPVSAVTI